MKKAIAIAVVAMCFAGTSQAAEAGLWSWFTKYMGRGTYDVM